MRLDLDLEALYYETRASLVQKKIEVIRDFIFEIELTPRYGIFRQLGKSTTHTSRGHSKGNSEIYIFFQIVFLKTHSDPPSNSLLTYVI
jgi:hypothetical protein